MNTTYSFQIYNSTSLLPLEWNSLADNNIFLTREYLEILENSSPVNMICHFIGIFDKEDLLGIVLTQFLFAEKLESFGERDQCLKTSVRNFALKNFASHVLFVGNNMLTGQNAFAFSPNIKEVKAIKTLHKAITQLKKDLKAQGKKVHITSIKDFTAKEIEPLQAEFKNNYTFSTQPNMVFEINKNWKTEQDYIDALSKKYRDQYKRARKKSEGVEKKKMSLADIRKYEDVIYELYFHVAKNAPFNTFFLARNHFSFFKEIMKDDFLLYGYFLDEKLIGFNT